MGITADGSAPAFTFVVVPDTQILSEQHPDILLQMVQWLIDHKEQLDLQMILHLGDVVHAGAADENQFLVASNAWNMIDQAQIPMLIAAGNHDYDNLLANDRNLCMFNKYFGLQRYHNQPWFGGAYAHNSAENVWAKSAHAGREYLFMVLEFGPRLKVLEWADQVIKRHPDHKVIIVTHSYMHMYGDRTKQGDKYNPKLYKGSNDAFDGEDLWQRFVRNHANIIAVFSGHQIPSNISYRTDVGDQGNIVFQSFQNWQYHENGGEGRFRVVEYHPENNIMRLAVFNPLQDKYEDHPGYEVLIDFNRITNKNPVVFP